MIEKIHQGVYGYRTEATIPQIAGGSGIPISGHLKIGKKWTYKGKRYSYVKPLVLAGARPQGRPIGADVRCLAGAGAGFTRPPRGA